MAQTLKQLAGSKTTILTTGCLFESKGRLLIDFDWESVEVLAPALSCLDRSTRMACLNTSR